MANFKEQEPWNENAVQIEDLGAPEKGFDFLLFSLGKKWHAAVRLRTTPAALIYTMCLVALLFLPGSTLLSPGPVARTPRSAASTPQQIYVECVALNINATTIVWQRSSSVPTPSGASVHTMPMCNIVPRGVGKP